MTDVAQYKARLNARLGELTGRLDGIEAELDSHHAADWEELATEREGDEVLEQMGLSGQQEILQIRAALTRIEAGEFGACVRCGTEIEPARLDLLPHTPFCKRCAA